MASTHVYAGTARSMGATAGGIFRQAAGDNRWEHLTNGLPEEADVHAITVHPENLDVVYVGLQQRFGIGHPTIQIERGDRPCKLSPEHIV